MIPILYQNNRFLVCVKPKDVLSQDGPGGSLPELLRAQTGGDIFPVHRLDRGVGGVMVCARTRRSAAALSEAVRGGNFQKEYLCILLGRPAEEAGVLRDLLLHDRTRNKSFVVSRMRGGVKEASLEYRVLAGTEARSLALVRLHTGRTHQIRVQFSSRHTPLAGDGRYGGGSGDIALWSFRIAFPDPLTGEALAFRQEPPEDFWRAWDGPRPEPLPF